MFGNYGLVHRYCPVHAVAKYLAGKSVGEKIFSLTPRDFTEAIKRCLKYSGVKDAAAVSGKSFRAGRATELAVLGEPLAEILAAGEWR